MKRGRPAKTAQDGAPKYEAVAYGDGATGRAFFTPHQIYALRIWHGQSVDVPIGERIERVVNGLRGQDMCIEVTLPHADAARYLDKYK